MHGDYAQTFLTAVGIAAGVFTIFCGLTGWIIAALLPGAVWWHGLFGGSLVGFVISLLAASWLLGIWR